MESIDMTLVFCFKRFANIVESRAKITKFWARQKYFTSPVVPAGTEVLSKALWCPPAAAAAAEPARRARARAAALVPIVARAVRPTYVTDYTDGSVYENDGS